MKKRRTERNEGEERTTRNKMHRHPGDQIWDAISGRKMDEILLLVTSFPRFSSAIPDIRDPWSRIGMMNELFRWMASNNNSFRRNNLRFFPLNNFSFFFNSSQRKKISTKSPLKFYPLVTIAGIFERTTPKSLRRRTTSIRTSLRSSPKILRTNSSIPPKRRNDFVFFFLFFFFPLSSSMAVFTLFYTLASLYIPVNVPINYLSFACSKYIEFERYRDWFQRGIRISSMEGGAY